jgi:hypothetical protein
MPAKYTPVPGEIYGSWTVISDAGVGRDRSTLVKCVCACSPATELTRKYIDVRTTQSCRRCSNKSRLAIHKPVPGQQIQKWTITGIAGRDKRRRLLVRCFCSCNPTMECVRDYSRLLRSSSGCRKCSAGDPALRTNRTKVITAWVSRGRGRPRGSYKVTLETNSEKLGLRRAYHAYQSGAYRRYIQWDLSMRDCSALFKADCHYCGIPPAPVGKGKCVYIRNGIDRVDNDKGYISGNVVSCCSVCNIAKRIRTQEEFEAWIIRAAAHISSRQKPLAASA